MKDARLQKAISQFQLEEAKKNKCQCKTHVSQEWFEEMMYNCIDGGNTITITSQVGNCSQKNGYCSGSCKVLVKCGDADTSEYAGSCVKKVSTGPENIAR